MPKYAFMALQQKFRLKICLIILFAFLTMSVGYFVMPRNLSAEPRTLKVVMDDNYPPYIFRDSEGKLVGLLVDQWKSWESKTGIKVEISAMDWADALQGMQAGKYDVIDTIFRNTEREKIYDFSAPHARLDAVIFFNRNIHGIQGIETLKGFNVGVKRGDHAAFILKQAGIHDLIEFNSYEAMILAARDRNLLIFVMDKPPAIYYLYKYGLKDEIRFSQPLYFGEFHRAVRKGDAETLQLVEAGFSKISRAEYESFDRKWFGSSPEVSPFDYRILLIFLSVVVLFVLILSLWNWTLRRTVRRKTRALTDSEKKFRELMMNLAIGVIVHDSAGKPTFWNTAALQETGLNEDQLTGKESFPVGCEYISGQGDRLDAGMFPARIVLASGKPLREYTMGIRQLDGTARWYQIDAFPDINTNTGRVGQVVVTFFDITVRRESEEKLMYISFHDALTGVYNRAYFEEELHRLDNRHGGSVAVAVADVDGMKQVNDTYGHTKGDELLIRAAELLRGCIRQEDVVARIGGDEFAVILRNAEEEAVAEIFDRVRQARDNAEEKTDEEIRLSLSFGYAFASEPGISAVDLFKEADNRMYQEKTKRRSRRR